MTSSLHLSNYSDKDNERYLRPRGKHQVPFFPLILWLAPDIPLRRRRYHFIIHAGTRDDTADSSIATS